MSDFHDVKFMMLSFRPVDPSSSARFATVKLRVRRQ